ncbi:hypothetical protein QO009_004066 [Brevibacillus aydinogluensis]|uniref:hypothetical protein n=1 Tax=Brevibacillus aydinogluensis TaxID=927786 RepID=UPI002892EEE6|nr:hypothetical protein [Brevibacillus aydinogluensis]MDT3418141.1 hypothetical protein [Brevibacillus aydinogluensis]
MRRVFVLCILAIMMGVTSIASAAATYPYGENAYGEKNIELVGDLSASGLSGAQKRPSIAYRHDVRVFNVISGAYTPSSGYLQSVQYDIQPLPGVEPSDAFKGKSGYHLIPLEQEIIKDYAAKQNGNADYVWKMVSGGTSSPWLKKYLVNGVPYINIGAVAYFSGGGLPDMRDAGGDGINSPLFRTTYLSTPWPNIPILAQDADGNIDLKAIGYSIYSTSVNVTAITNGDPSTKTTIVPAKSSPVNNYSVEFDGTISITKFRGLKNGTNTITVTAGDTFGRTTSKTITIQYNSNKPPKPVRPKKLSMRFLKYKDPVNVYNDTTVPVEFSNNKLESYTFTATFTLTGVVSQPYQVWDSGCKCYITKYRNLPMKQTAVKTFTLPAKGVTVWTVGRGDMTYRLLSGSGPIDGTIGNMNVKGYRDDDGYILDPHPIYNPEIKVEVDSASAPDFWEPMINDHIRTKAIPVQHRGKVRLSG